MADANQSTSSPPSAAGDVEAKPAEETKPTEGTQHATVPEGQTNGTETRPEGQSSEVCREGEGAEPSGGDLGNGEPIDGEFVQPTAGGEDAANFMSDVMQQQPRLDVHLAVIEEQFRRGFDERYSTPSLASQKQVWEDPVETIRTNKIFREVSRGLGGEWRGVFDELMAPFPREVAEMELGKISTNSPLIQGYKALNAWKEASGRSYSLMKLVEVLRNQDYDDIADAVIYIIDNDSLPDSKDKSAKPVQRRKSDLTPQKNPAALDNRRLLLIAKKIEGKYEPLAKELGIPDEELAEIKEAEGETYQGTFKVLWSWREARLSAPPTRQEEGVAAEPPQSDVELLKSALEKVDLKAVAEQIDSI